jgi:Lipopolysaccharide export system permease LptF/LptG
MTPRAPLPGARLKRFAAQIFDRATLETVASPALADLQYECVTASGPWTARALIRIRAYWSLFKLFGLCGARMVVHDTGLTLSNVAGRMTVAVSILTFLLVLPVLVPELPRIAARAGTSAAISVAVLAINVAVLLVPQALVIALPCAFVIALATARRRQIRSETTRMVFGTIGGSIVCGALVFVLAMVIVPASNQAYRIVIVDVRRATGHPSSESVTLSKGLAEMTWTELNYAMARPASAQQFAAARAHVHLRFALCVAPCALGLLATGLLAPLRSRIRALGGSIALLGAYWWVLAATSNWAVSPGHRVLEVWTANVIFGALAVLILWWRRDRSITT